MPQPTGTLSSTWRNELEPVVTTLGLLPGEPILKLIRSARLLERLRDLADQLDDPAELRQALKVLFELGDLFGLAPAWTKVLANVIANDASIEALAKVFGWLERAGRLFAEPREVQPQATVETQSIVTWLPVALQIARLIAELIGASRKKPIN